MTDVDYDDSTENVEYMIQEEHVLYTSSSTEPLYTDEQENFEDEEGKVLQHENTADYYTIIYLLWYFQTTVNAMRSLYWGGSATGPTSTPTWGKQLASALN